MMNARYDVGEGRHAAAWRAGASVLLAAFLAIAAPGRALAGAEILWDRWGVPHIFAEDRESAFRALGRAEAESHGPLILRLYAQARGRAAEIYGEDYVASDREIWTFGVPGRAQAWRDALSPDYRRYVAAFADGINAFAAAHPEIVGERGEAVLPVTAADVLAHQMRVFNLVFLGGDWKEQVASWTAKRGGKAAGLPSGDGPRGLGSNSWAVAPSRTAEGNALLLVNPHLPWRDLFTFYEFQLKGPAIDAYGASLVGLPFVAIGFNDHLGWTHTVNTIDAADLYELTLGDGGYLFDGERRDFTRESRVIRVRGEDGVMREETFEILRSVHGPVVAQAGDRALAFRIAGLDRPHMIEQYWDMGSARNLAEFERAVSRLQMPMFNLVYADRDGHILYLFNGVVPRRPAGGWDFWNGVVPGDSSMTLWRDYVPYEGLPRLLDPASGWVQNSNDPPWSATFPMALDPADYQPSMAPIELFFRPQRGIRMISAAERMTLDELSDLKHSTRMELADRILDDLLDAARGSGDEDAIEAAHVLETWDRAADSGSRGAVLFAAWFARMNAATGGDMFAEPWDVTRPRETPDGLADPAAAAAALAAAAREMRARYGALDVAWGEVHRLRLGGRDLPANGGDGALGIFRVVGFAEGEDGRAVAQGGDSFVSLVEFGAEGPRAQALLSYGNASIEGSPHLGDQLELLAAKALRPVWRHRPVIEENLEAREVID